MAKKSKKTHRPKDPAAGVYNYRQNMVPAKPARNKKKK